MIVSPAMFFVGLRLFYFVWERTQSSPLKEDLTESVN